MASRCVASTMGKAWQDEVNAKIDLVLRTFCVKSRFFSYALCCVRNEALFLSKTGSLCAVLSVPLYDELGDFTGQISQQGS